MILPSNYEYTVLTVVTSIYIGVYIFVGLYTLWNVYKFLLVAKYYRNPYIVGFYALALTVIFSRFVNLLWLDIFYNS